MPDTRQQFSGSKIRAARHAAGMTQAALARAVNTRERNIIRWENDQHEPRFEHVAAIARATGKPLEFFGADPEEAATADDDEESDAVAALMRVLRRFVRDELRAERGFASPRVVFGLTFALAAAGGLA